MNPGYQEGPLAKVMHATQTTGTTKLLVAVNGVAQAQYRCVSPQNYVTAVSQGHVEIRMLARDDPSGIKKWLLLV